MNADAQIPLNPPVFEFPQPPDEFGQDGGKFYRCYDALAEEIDEDMVKGLKEQLDGMLIFAGLFAGVNSAFLALTIPLLSADPADDTNALLAQNNAILMQLAMGTNDSLPTSSVLPSATFSPSHDLFTINALFSLSLAFAIISSFLAVLGRQWLVYYRKRSGGGPDRQRWEQLKRFLGAERWRLEAILDDVLPSLLQIGLIIFFASLILYLRHLSPTISLIVGIPLYVGLTFFVGSGLCTIWDRFCPFHSPLSHLLLWATHSTTHSFSRMIQKVRRFMFYYDYGSKQWKLRLTIPKIKSSIVDWFHSTVAFVRDNPLGRTKNRVKELTRQGWPWTSSWFHFLHEGRKEESPESLQAIAVQRAICISDDQATLLHATANIFGIKSPDAMELLWNERPFRERFLELVQGSVDGMLLPRGYNVNPREFAESGKRLYLSAAAHIILTLSSDPDNHFDLCRPIIRPDLIAYFIPVPLLKESSTSFIKGNLGCFSICSIFGARSVKEIDGLGHRLTAFSEVLASCSDYRFLSFYSWIVSRYYRESSSRWDDEITSMRGPYSGNVNDAMKVLRDAFVALLRAESKDPLDRDTVLTNMLQCAQRIMTDEGSMNIEHILNLLGTCEIVLRNPQGPATENLTWRNLRTKAAQIWSQEYDKSRDPGVDGRLFNALQSYLAHLRTFERTETGYHEDITIAQAFGFTLNNIWHLTGSLEEQLVMTCETFNAFVWDVHKISRQIQNSSRRARDPDECWCHRQEEPLQIERTRTWWEDELLLPSGTVI